MTTLDFPTENFAKKKTLLMVDIIAQPLILAVCAMLLFVDGFAALCGIYFVLGGYQLISSIIHLYFKPISAMRKAYYPQLIIHLIILSVGILTGHLLILYVELFATAVTALYYLTTTIVDFIEIKRKG